MTRLKGHSLIDFPSDYTVIDIETTGLDPSRDKIIELAALKIRDNKIVDSYESLVNPDMLIDSFIYELTGITNDELSVAPDITSVLSDYCKFIGDDVVVGHNVHFDINFVYDNLLELSPDLYFSNNFIDTLRLSRKYYKQLPSHKLSALSDYLNLSVETFHRSLADCNTTYQLYMKLQEASTQLLDSEAPLLSSLSFDETNPFYNKRIAVKGLTQNYSFTFMKSVSEKCHARMSDVFYRTCDYIVFSRYTYRSYKRGNNSEKFVKAEKLVAEGTLKIISEDEWCAMLGLPFVKDLPKHKDNISAKDIVTEITDFDETHPLFGNTFVFTGALDRMLRKDAMQIVVDHGGFVGNSVTKKTNFLVLGNNDYCPNIKDGKSSKQKKAESLKLSGFDIDIISENTFYDMIVDD